MIQVHKFEVNPLGENCYVVWDDSCEGIIIDCGAWGEQEEEQIARFVADKGIQLRYALQTHMHFDHVLGLDFVHRTYGLSPLCHAMLFCGAANSSNAVKKANNMVPAWVSKVSSGNMESSMTVRKARYR